MNVFKRSWKTIPEAGTADVTLAQLSRLQVGDVLDLDASEAGLLTVRVEGRPKFSAVRGAVGGRAALQIVNHVGTDGGPSGE